MGKITFVIGGARSGKSSFALAAAKESGARKIAFIATGQAFDEEMRRRIDLHKKARPAGWKTFEEPRELAQLIRKVGGRFELIVLDCLTLYVSNLLLDGLGDAAIEKEARGMIAALTAARAGAVIVSNEVGLGIVPETKLGRDFRDIAGRINQMIARKADEVFFTAAGIPWRIK